MSKTPSPLFLERRSYRRRRLMDFARVLPIAGAFFFAVPLLWSLGDDTVSKTTHAVIYLFLIWLGLIAIAWALAGRLSPTDEELESEDDI